MPLGDEQRVLPVEADTRACRRLAVDVLIGVDEHAVGRLEQPPEHIELLPQLGVGVMPGIPRQSPMAGRELGLGRVVAECGRDDGAGAFQQLLGMTRDLGPGRREAEPAEEAARLALADVALGALVGLGRGHTDRVEPELVPDPLQLRSGHRLHCYSGSNDSLPSRLVP